MIAITAATACRSGHKSQESPVAPPGEARSGLLGNADEALAALVAIERSAGVTSWDGFRRLDRYLAGRGSTGYGTALRVEAVEGLVRALWSKASARAEGEVTAADIDAAATIPAVELPADRQAGLERFARSVGIAGLDHYRPTAEHWRAVLAAITNEIYVAGADPLEPMAGKALEALAEAASRLSLLLLQRSAAAAAEASSLEIDGDHVKAAYKKLAAELDLDNRPREIAPLPRMDVARLLIPLTRELVENKARALAANGRASGDLGRDLSAISESQVTAEASEIFYQAARSLVRLAASGIDPMRADNALFDGDLSGAELEGGAYVQRVRVDNAIQQVIPHRLLEGGDVVVRVVPNPATAAGEAVELKLAAAAVDRVRDSAAQWRLLAEVLGDTPYAIDPIAAERLADAVAVMLAASVERAGRAAGGGAITAEIAAKIAGRAELVVAPRRPGPAWPSERQERKAAVLAALRSPLFADVTASSGLPGEVDGKGSQNPAALAGGGVAVGDVDGDGYPDLFLAGGGLGRLMLNRGKRRGLVFEDVTEAMGLPGDLDDSRGAVLFDLEGDGDLDLLVLRGEHPPAIFTLDAGAYTDASSSLGFAAEPGAQAGLVFDYDRDGDLDVLLGYWGPAETRPAIDGGNGRPNQLWRNEGGALVEVGGQAKIAGAAWTRAVGSLDFDMDGDLDVYVSNDFGADALYLNMGDGTFVDVADSIGTGDRGAGAGFALADVNGDGFWDLYAGGVDAWFAAAELVLPRDPKAYDVDDALLGASRHLSGDQLFVSQPGGAAMASEKAARLEPGERGWVLDAVFADVDLDGDDDLYVANGWVAGDSNQLYLRDGEVFFRTPKGGAERVAGNTRGVAAADFDRDGDIDLICVQHGAPPVALLGRGRQAAPRNRWIRLSLSDSKTAANPRGVGSTLRIDLGGRSLLRQLATEVHAGVGTARTVDVTVRWPDGSETQHRRLPVNRAHVLKR